MMSKLHHCATWDRRPTISDGEDECRARQMMKVISPKGVDPFAEGKSVSFSPTLFTVRIMYCIS